MSSPLSPRVQRAISVASTGVVLITAAISLAHSAVATPGSAHPKFHGHPRPPRLDGGIPNGSAVV